MSLINWLKTASKRKSEDGYQPLFVKKFSTGDGTDHDDTGPLVPCAGPHLNLRSRVAAAKRRKERSFDANRVEEMLQKLEKEVDFKDDTPVDLTVNPYQLDQRRCYLCVHDIPVDYKNTRLLSQFISPRTGRIYDRTKTGLCIHMQREVARQIKRAQLAGFLPYFYTRLEYRNDPVIYNQFVPITKRAKRRKSEFLSR